MIRIRLGAPAALLAFAGLACGGGGTTATDTTPPQTTTGGVTVEVGDNFFKPETLSVPVGTKVVWNWTGSQPHTVSAQSGATFDSPQQTSGTFTHTFDKAGTVKYFCTVHGQAMSGTVTVTS